MKRGYLSDYFEGVAAKRLSPVEVDALKSHQHEFNGVEGLRRILGEPEGNVHFRARLIYLTDDTEEPVVDDSELTWYDARQRGRIERGVMRWEYRLYFKANNVSINAVAGDLLVIAKSRDESLLVIVAADGSSIARQLQWLFGFDVLEDRGFTAKSDLGTERDHIEFTSRLILESIGVEVEVELTAEDYLDQMLETFGGVFPNTRAFSAFSRSTLDVIDARAEPDLAIMTWMEREEILFRTLERHLIADRLSKGFARDEDGDVDVEGFMSFSLSVQNRRKSRVGYALENHLEFLFTQNELSFKRNATTENRATPDFMFPGQLEYDNKAFDSLRLTMLGVKSTCKDRWRQVLAEADRVQRKHLLTLETSISPNQTDEMESKDLQLVLPIGLHMTYTPTQQDWLMDVRTFTELVRSRQER